MKLYLENTSHVYEIPLIENGIDISKEYVLAIATEFSENTAPVFDCNMLFVQLNMYNKIVKTVAKKQYLIDLTEKFNLSGFHGCMLNAIEPRHGKTNDILDKQIAMAKSFNGFRVNRVAQIQSERRWITRREIDRA